MSRRREVPGSRLITLIAQLVPRHRRAEWLAEWQSELAHAYAQGVEAGEESRRISMRLRFRGLASMRDALSLMGIGRASAGSSGIRDALRTFRRQPGFIAAVVVTLGMGMGATTAIFSVVDALLLDPLPFTDPERIVQIDDGRGWNGVVDAALLDQLKAEERLFSAVRAHVPRSVTLTGAGEPRSLRLIAAEPGFMAMLGLSPRIGRDIGEDEAAPGRDRVILLSDEIWRGAFNADPGVVGRTVRLSGELYTVIGVLPVSLRVMPGGLVHGLVPLAMPLPAASPYAYALGRLRSDVAIVAAQARLDEIAAIMNREQPREGGWKPDVTHINTAGFRNERTALLALSGAALFLLLIACANAAGLLFVRGVARDAELSVRRALGATRWVLFRQLLGESAVIAVLAGALGTVIAWWGVRALLAIAPETIVRWHYAVVSVNGRALGFTFVLTVLTGLFFGIVPAAWASRRSDGARRSDRTATIPRAQMRTRRAVQVVQIALAVLLLCGAGLLGHSFLRLAAVDPGYDADRVLNLTFSATEGRTREARAVFNRQLDEKLRALPGVETVAWANGLGLEFTDELEAEGSDVSGISRIIVSTSVDTAFFGVMGVRMLEGRMFTAGDVGAEPRVVIVDRDLAGLLWPGASAVGRRVRTSTAGPWYTVVGVTADAKLEGPDDRDRPWVMYHPTSPERVSYAATRIRTKVRPASLAAAVRETVRALDPDLPIIDLLPAREAMAEEMAQPRFVLAVMVVFAGLALLLAAIGVYGLVAFSVARRSREIGIRMAIGARDAQVVRMVFRDGMFPAFAGIALGLAGASALSRFMESLLFGITRADPAAYLFAATVLMLACATALLAPARRAAAIDPASTLRAD